MIIVKIIGGLGNQMFQYAAGRQLSLLNNCELKLDITGYETYALHKFGLDKFAIKSSFATKKEIGAFQEKPYQKFRRILFAYLHIPMSYKNTKYVRESGVTFDRSILGKGDGIYLDGYWGSEKYFLPAEKTIREDFQIVPAPDTANTKMLALIDTSTAVSIHIRRGDYVSNQTTNQYHGTCSLEYYAEGVKIISAAVPNPTFFIFSDDPAWVKENLKLQAPAHFVDINGPDKNYEDLRLMSYCQHHIIANSTFSWWGAWLARHSNQKVIAPAKWFNHGADTSDLVPADWQRI